MPRITKVYTRSGDDGSTALGDGQRVSKASQRVRACGAVDELNAQLGLVQAAGPSGESADALRRIQNHLFHLGAELSVPQTERGGRPGPRIEARQVQWLEQLIDRLNRKLKPLRNFVLPGGVPAAAHLHLARTVCRRAEREVVALAGQEPVGPMVIMYLNRLSDALFVMARCENKLAGADEPLWDTST